MNSGDIHISNELKRAAHLFSEAGFPLYAVGGMVRNPCLGFPVSDVDITSAMTPDAVLALAKANGIHCVEKGIRFGMVELHIGDESFEHTTFRADTYGTGGAHKPTSVRFSESIDEDAVRRDFTVNAMYLDLLSGAIIDPTGGMRDLEKKLIRATRPDPDAIMRDDGLRIMRMARFAGELGFTVEENTFEAAKANACGLADISGERVRQELDKILLCDVRYGAGEESMANALMLLRDTGAIDVLFPELARGRGIEQKKEYHAHDVLDHCLWAAVKAEPMLVIRIASLLHDVGKPEVYYATGKMLNHDRVGVDIAKNILTRLRYDRFTENRVLLLIRNHMLDLNGMAKDSTLRERFAVLGREASEQLCFIREADVHGSGIIMGEVKTAVRWRRVLADMVAANTPFQPSEVDCTGADIMEWTGLPAGPDIGSIKYALFLHCARHPGDNRKARLREIARDMRKPENRRKEGKR